MKYFFENEIANIILIKIKIQIIKKTIKIIGKFCFYVKVNERQFESFLL